MTRHDQMRTGIDLLSTLVLLIIAGLLTWEHGWRAAGIAGSLTMRPVSNATIDLSMLTKRLGSGSVVLLEFGDFECPYCARHTVDEAPKIVKSLVDTGLVTYGFLHFPLQDAHPNAFGASAAAECAGRQSRYWEMHHRLFANQSSLGPDDWMGHAAGVGLDVERFTSCVGGETTHVVEADIALGRRLGVTGTPTFFLGLADADGIVQLRGRFDGTVGFEAIRDAVSSLRPDSRWTRWLPWSRS